MSTGQTILTIGALGLITTVMMNFYRVLASTGDDIASGQDGILATTLATSYMELANGMAFDAYTDTGHVEPTQVSLLTKPVLLGQEDPSEDSIYNFDDFDDFNGFSIEREAGGSGRRYMATFKVYYVDPNNVDSYSAARTFVKRMDIKIWRTYPLAGQGVRLDTLRTSQIRGYFHFD